MPSGVLAPKKLHSRGPPPPTKNDGVHHRRRFMLATGGLAMFLHIGVLVMLLIAQFGFWPGFGAEWIKWTFLTLAIGFTSRAIAYFITEACIERRFRTTPSHLIHVFVHHFLPVFIGVMLFSFSHSLMAHWSQNGIAPPYVHWDATANAWSPTYPGAFGDDWPLGESGYYRVLAMDQFASLLGNAVACEFVLFVVEAGLLIRFMEFAWHVLENAEKKVVGAVASALGFA